MIRHSELLKLGDMKVESPIYLYLKKQRFFICTKEIEMNDNEELREAGLNFRII